MNPAAPTQLQILRIYYAATAVFIILDYIFDINVRLAFLEQAPAWRVVYYTVILCCLGLMVWQPKWTTLIATIESLMTLVFLILHMGIRATTVSDAVLSHGGTIVTMNEVLNFLISGTAAYIAYWRGMGQLGRDRKRH